MTAQPATRVAVAFTRIRGVCCQMVVIERDGERWGFVASWAVEPRPSRVVDSTGEFVDGPAVGK